MPFAIAPVKSELDPIRLACALYTQPLIQQAREKAAEQERLQAAKRREEEDIRRSKALVEHTVDQMDANRFRMAYSLGKPAHPDMLELMMDDYTITLAAEEVDNHPDRARRHILIHGITCLMQLKSGIPVTLVHVNGIEVSATLAMRILPTFSRTAIHEAALTLNRLWLEHGIEGARPMPECLAPRKTLSLPKNLRT